jgi:hypothetical protein
MVDSVELAVAAGLVVGVYYVAPKVLFPALARWLRETRPADFRRRTPWSFLAESRRARLVWGAVWVVVGVPIALLLPGAGRAARGTGESLCARTARYGYGVRGRAPVPLGHQSP